MLWTHAFIVEFLTPFLSTIFDLDIVSLLFGLAYDLQGYVDKPRYVSLSIARVHIFHFKIMLYSCSMLLLYILVGLLMVPLICI